MNFLGHAYLSFGDEKLLIGNFVADFVKGKHLTQYDASIQRGIRLHRRIDAFTDYHPAFLKSKRILQPRCRHYSAVVVDIIYDHMLAKFWDEFHDVRLLQFTETMYETVLTYKEVLPPAARHVLSFMVPANWLYNYRSLAGVRDALGGMSRRARFDSHMDEAIVDLQEHSEAFEAHFREFMPTVIAEAKSFVEKSAIGFAAR